MKIAVCVRQGRDGELNPFDASAYELALRIPGAEITLVSMGPRSVEGILLQLTRLGAKQAMLLCDTAFAGSDTLATAYVLSLAIQKLHPDLVVCGRQTLEGDTAQTGPMLSVLTGRSLATNVMELHGYEPELICSTPSEGEVRLPYPALITAERKYTLRFPSIRSKVGTVEILSAADLGADTARCGLSGSPTRVLQTFENQRGKRKCEFITPDRLMWAVEQGLQRHRDRTESTVPAGQIRLPRVCAVGEAVLPFAQSVSDDITLLPLTNAADLAERLERADFSVVLFGSDPASKRVAAQVAAMRGLGLCADCTSLETDGTELLMYRPARSGSIIAKIRSLTRPAMATVRTSEGESRDVVVCAGYGAKDALGRVNELVQTLGAELATTRKMVDQGILPYEGQVGLTGKCISPAVYIAIGVSGAVHHIVGMQSAGTVIAINLDKDAPIFDYADYGVIAEF